MWRGFGAALLPLAMLSAQVWQFRVERGEALVTGETSEFGLPAGPGAVARQPNGQECPTRYGTQRLPCADGFFLRLRTADGSIAYATYLGGKLYDSIHAAASDADGNVYLVGETASTDFPITQNAAQSTYRGGHDTPLPFPNGGDAFLAKLDRTGRLVYATYLGGTGKDSATSVVADAGGGVHVAGWTESEDFPVTAGAYQRRYTPGPPGTLPRRNGFFARYDASGRLSYATYFAAPGASSMVVGRGGDIVVTGGFLARFRPAENQVVSYTEQAGGTAVAVNESGNVFLAGSAGPNFQTTAGAFQPSYRGGDSDSFLMRLNLDGTTFFATFLGGSRPDRLDEVAVDGQGRVVVLGWSGSYNFPTSSDAPHPCKQGLSNSADPVLARFDAAGRFLHGTYLAPRQGDIRMITLDREGIAWALGWRMPLTGPPGLELFARWQEGGFLERLETDPPAVPRVTCVASAASRIPGLTSPGELLTIYGPRIGPESEYGIALDETGKVRTSAGNVWVEFTGAGTQRAPILYASPNQLNVVTPFAVLPGEVLVTVKKNGLTAGSMRLSVGATHPGIFTLDGSGGGQGAILNEDGTLNSPANPAAHGSIVTLYATGLGQTDPPVLDGSVYSGELPRLRTAVAVKFAGIAGEVLYAGPAPGMVAGVMQINVRLPQALFAWPQFPIWLETAEPSGFWVATLATR